MAYETTTVMTLYASVLSESVIVGLAALLSVFFLTLPSFYRIWRRLYQGRQQRKVQLTSQSYEDEDGIATEDARKAYSAAIPKYIALAGTSIGLVVNLFTNVYSEAQPTLPSRMEHWLAFGSWTLLFLQIVHIATEYDPIRRFHSGVLAAITSAVILAALIAEKGLRSLMDHNSWTFDIFVVLYVIQLCAGLMIFFSCFSIRRRPSLMLDNHTVDEQYTVSALDRYTFAWAGQTLRLVRSQKLLSLETIPKLHLRIRSAFLEKYVGGRRNDRDHLPKTLLRVHGLSLIFQTFFALGSTVAQFAPQVVMFALLKLLEQKADSSDITKGAWALVIALCLSILVSAWGEAWTHWISISRLGLPLRTELAAMVFSKATRRKDVKGTVSQSEQKSEATPPDDADGVNGSSQTGSDSSDPAQEDLQQSRQRTINLVGVDAERVADFAMNSFIFPWTIAEMVISIVFLIQLVGWKSLLSGFAIFIVVLPLNTITSKYFADAQSSLMTIRDKKLIIITEALHGIRQIKFSAQEDRWQNRIEKIRQEELAIQWKVFCLETCLIAIWILGPVMLSAVSLAVYAYLHGSLSASVAFTSISVFGSLEMTLAVVPELVSDALEAFVSVKRIDEYLRAPEKENSSVPNETIVFQNASMAWPSDRENENEDPFILRDIDLQFPMKELTVICGATGTGKSLLLAAIIGEAEQVAGIIARPDSPLSKDRYDHRANRTDWILDSAIAFVAQIPWIENASIKENILFGLPFDIGRYNKVLFCCALEKDLQILPDGDQTDIGANGINLSGGQRWRVSFARALYSRAGILVLDDIFSAVDAHVGRHLFEEALTGELGEGRTRILVTHHVGLCIPKAKYSVILADGTVKYAGLPNEGGVLMKDEKRQAVLPHNQQEPTVEDDGEMLRQVPSHASHRSNKVDNGEMDIQGKLQPKKFVEDEKRETGSIKLAIYREYLMSSGGIWFWGPILAVFMIYEGIVLGRSWFVSLWTKSYDTNASFLIQQYRDTPIVSSIRTAMVKDFVADTNLIYYLSVYIGLSVVICILGTLRYFSVYWASLYASKTLFESITYAVLRAPLRWLDTIPVGRILNRMTADFALIDSDLAGDIGLLLYEGIQLFGIIIASLLVSPWMLLSALVLLILCGRVTSLYLSSAREVKRLNSNAKSPIFEQFGSALAGIGTIRAYGKSEIYIDRMFDKIDDYTRTSWYLFLVNRWLVWRLDIVGAVFTIFIAAVIVHSHIEASLAGFALSFALQYSSALIWSAKQYADVELSMNAVERVSEYAKIPIEDQSKHTPVPAAWPTEGRLRVKDLVAGYADDLPSVLKGLSFNVEKNQRVGVVGRTGAGKSSLTLALFRFLEPRSGSIHIDGIDISKIALSTLRSSLAIMPQDPVLFSGTVRSNLDPFDNHSDGELNEALERVRLIHSHNPAGTTSHDEPATTPTPASGSDAPTLTESPVINTNKNVFSSLTSRISEGGLNLSQGQRQLLCLARAIVSRPKLMVLDEATSAVDMATDALIQRSIREEFQDSTLIVIAHRLSTIADFERVLVMDEGRGVEFDTPRRLIDKEGGVFKSMVEQSGEVEILRNIIGRAGNL